MKPEGYTPGFCLVMSLDSVSMNADVVLTDNGTIKNTAPKSPCIQPCLCICTYRTRHDCFRSSQTLQYPLARTHLQLCLRNPSLNSVNDKLWGLFCAILQLVSFKQLCQSCHVSLMKLVHLLFGWLRDFFHINGLPDWKDRNPPEVRLD